MDNNIRNIIEKYDLEEGVFENTLIRALKIIDKNMDYFDDSFFHVSKSNKYSKIDNVEWTAGFFPGMVLNAYSVTKNIKFTRNNAFYLNSFEERLNSAHMESHDIGFLYSLSVVAIYKLMNNKKAKDIALEAVDKLVLRYNSKGEFIQAWGKMDARYPEVKAIIDCMMNLPLLYWASEVTGQSYYAEIAEKHALTTLNTLVRDDFSVYHTYMFDPISGRPITGGSHQGKYAESTWARGQAWAIYGYALSYKYTKNDVFLDTAKQAADYYIANLPKDFVHYWDFSASDIKPEMKDSSAGSIGVCGLLELSQQLPKEQGHFYEKCGKIILQKLCQEYFFETVEEGFGLLRESYYSSTEFNECTAWGDYFFVEALCRVVHKEEYRLLW